jgi:hypothetical protein
VGTEHLSELIATMQFDQRGLRNDDSESISAYAEVEIDSIQG